MTCVPLFDEANPKKNNSDETTEAIEKLDSWSLKCGMVGYNLNGHNVLDVKSRIIISSRDVKLSEVCCPNKLTESMEEIR